jgi:hypothetical protein
MTPHDTNLVTRLDVNDLVGRRRVGVASYAPIVHILNRVVGRRDTDTIALAIVLAVDTDALGDSVGGAQSGQEGDSYGEETHFDQNETLLW